LKLGKLDKLLDGDAATVYVLEACCFDFALKRSDGSTPGAKNGWAVVPFGSYSLSSSQCRPKNSTNGR
jgi:hypothetical protein